MLDISLKRRDVIAGLGAAAVYPFAGRAQTAATPVIGFLHSEVAEKGSERFFAFHKALADAGLPRVATLRLITSGRRAGWIDTRRWQPNWSAATCR
jgi:hypothetical protein